MQRDLTDEQIDAIADAHRWDTREGRRALVRAALASAPAADDWRQYATEREETAQAVIERHRAEQGALLKLLAADRTRIATLEAASAPAAEPVLEWCVHCGEGTTGFCRSKCENRACPKALPRPGQDSDPQAQVVGSKVYLVATGETHNGQETYTRHETPVPLADQEVLYSGQDEFDAWRQS